MALNVSIPETVVALGIDVFPVSATILAPGVAVVPNWLLLLSTQDSMVTGVAFRPELSNAQVNVCGAGAVSIFVSVACTTRWKEPEGDPLTPRSIDVKGALTVSPVLANIAIVPIRTEISPVPLSLTGVE